MALFLFGHETSEALGQLAANASTYGDTASARAVPFEVAAVDFEIRERREGIRFFAFVPDRRPENSNKPRGSRHATAVVDGVLKHDISLRNQFEGNRFGLAVAALFGVHIAQPVRFAGGVMAFAPDPVLFQNMALGIAGTVVLAALVVAVLAAFVGRYITQQAIRPLVEVTEALQRFAARDFGAQPIAVAGRSDFDVLAHAYNAASTQVAEAFAERDAAEAQMRQFVADAGHELRTPLTIVLGYIDLLRRKAGPDDERAKFIFASIASEGRRMRTLVDNLVLLAKLEADDARPVEPFDVGALIEEIAGVRRGLDPTVQISIDARIDGTVVGERAEIHEALANIVDNAIKYAPGSPIHIALDSPRAGAIVIAVSDSGPGIPPEDRDAIFERFYRGASRGEVEGSGLGLAIARRALERAGGTLALDATVEHGTRFVLTLRAERIERRPTFV